MTEQLVRMMVVGQRVLYMRHASLRLNVTVTERGSGRLQLLFDEPHLNQTQCLTQLNYNCNKFDTTTFDPEAILSEIWHVHLFAFALQGEGGIYAKRENCNLKVIEIEL